MSDKIKSARFLVFAVFLSVLFFGHRICSAQEAEKSIQSEELVKKRPVARGAAQIKRVAGKNTIGRTNNAAATKKRYYRLIKAGVSKKPAPQSKAAFTETEEAMLGLTIWKIRPATKNDAAKELVEEEQGGKIQNSEYTLERMQSDTLLAVGEKIRLSIESLSQSGYLYVVEREQYGDGTFSSPKLIYPTLKTKNLNNPIDAGNLVFVPEAPRYFRVTATKSDKKQVAEVLTIIVSPQILVAPSMLQTKAIELPVERLAEWIKQWEADVTLLEQIDGAGETITLTEQSAAQDAAKGLNEESSKLTQADAIPQSIFRSRIKRGQPVLVNVYLNIDSK